MSLPSDAAAAAVLLAIEVILATDLLEEWKYKTLMRGGGENGESVRE